jgi:hypothetical protein
MDPGAMPYSISVAGTASAGVLLQFLAPYRSAVPVRIESLSSTMRLDDDDGRIDLPQLLSNLKIIRALA